MNGIRIDTAKVISAAQQIAKNNTAMHDGFKSVENMVNSMNAAWDGSVSEAAVNRFFAIKNACLDARYTSLDNYVRFLHEMVGEGYESTEITNTSLADAFK